MGTQTGKSRKAKPVVREVVVSNPTGIHARPASMFVKLASTFGCEVTVTKDGESVNGKSIMGLLTLAASQGSALMIEATGADAEACANALERLVAGNFNEGAAPTRTHAG